MSGNIFSYIHYLGIFILSLFVQGIDVSDTIPATLEPGSSATVTATISKSSVQGFAKLQLDIPAGLSVSPLDTKGASFTFSGGKAKFIWMTLPTEESFSVTYKLKADATASGQFLITGIFSYIEENNRVDYNLQAKTVQVGAALASTPDEPGQSPGSAEPSEEPVVEQVEEAAQNVTADAAVTSISNAEFNGLAYREITPLGNDLYSVKVILKNTDFQGYAKIEERLPGGAQATNKNNAGAVVTIDKGVVKYVWFDIPKTSNLSVIYQVQGSGIQSISGDFHFVDGNTPKKVAIMTAGEVAPIASNAQTSGEEKLAAVEPEPVKEVAKEKREDVAQNTGMQQKSTEMEAKSSGDNAAKEEPVAAVIEKETQQEESVGGKKETNNTVPVKASKEVQRETETATAEAKKGAVGIPEPERGIVYKVQIAAGPNTVGKSYFSSRHSFTESFQIENHEGWVKYTTGSHASYGDARSNRERIRERYNFDGPFVTAYNSGERITVQEALMITNQQWIP